MNFPKAIALTLGVLCFSSAGAQEFESIDSGEPPVIVFDDSHTATSPSDAVIRTRPTAAEIRQARALRQAEQRRARLEHNLWMGYEPLRPNWNSLPMMSSRYAPRRTIYVPIFVH